MALPHDVADLLNEALPATWAAFASSSPQAAIADTLDAAEAIDRVIAGLPAAAPIELVLAERPALLDRSIHRSEHVRAMERTIAEAR